MKGGRTINGQFSSLQILDLASNSFSGNLPKEWFNELKAMIAKRNDDGQVVGNRIYHGRFYEDTITVTFKGSGHKDPDCFKSDRFLT